MTPDNTNSYGLPPEMRSLVSYALLDISESAKEDLERRYPDSLPTEAISKALERLKTLEQILDLT
jgi:hypothetical protein